MIPTAMLGKANFASADESDFDICTDFVSFLTSQGVMVEV